VETMRLRDVPLRKRNEETRDISRERFEAYMLHLGVRIEWVKRDSTIAADGSRQCVICLVHQDIEQYRNRYAKNTNATTCKTCRARYGGSGHNRGNTEARGSGK
jgi:hypothetical protein